MIWKELLQDIDRAQREMARWMDLPLQQSVTFPPVSIYKNAEGLLLHADVPGVAPEDVDVSIANDVVTISGKAPRFDVGEKVVNRDEVSQVTDKQEADSNDSKGEAQKSAYRALRRERFAGEFTRTIELPMEVDSAKAEAVVKNGVLSITLPLREERKPRKISVVKG